MTDRLAMYGLLAGCLGLAALIFWELRPETGDNVPTLAHRMPAAAAAAPAARRASAAGLDELVTAILARPLFSASRRPPASAADGGLVGGELTNARLTGIVTEPGHRIALFALPGPKTVVLGKGGAVGDWRIEQITPQEVALDGPAGTATLRPRIDPARPIPAAPQALSANPAALRAAQRQAASAMTLRPHPAPGPASPASSMATPMRPRRP